MLNNHKEPTEKMINDRIKNKIFIQHEIFIKLECKGSDLTKIVYYIFGQSMLAPT